MKKFVKGILSLACCLCVGAGFVACDDSVTAYELAVQNGFTGTQAEWLLSLHGANGEDGEDLKIEDMYAIAKANGYTGTILDFMKEWNVEVQTNNDTDTIAENALSIMNICCGFSKTTNGGYWGSSQTEYYASAGSGVIIDLNKEAGSALIVTNYHVLYDGDSDAANGISDNIRVYAYGAVNRFTPDKTASYTDDGITATYVGGAMNYDIALLRIEGSEYLKNSAAKEAKLGNSDTVRFGEEVYAIGNPDGAGTAVTEGIISVETEDIVMTSIDGKSSMECRVMRTDAAINHGNSGGGLFNVAGELIGITNAKNAGSEVDNMGYALPITQVKYICENILDNGGVLKRAMLGIEIYTTTRQSGYDENGVLQLCEEFAVGKAATSENDASYNLLSVGDVFLSMQINGGETVQFTRQYQLTDLMLTIRKGDTVVFGIRNSDGAQKQVTVKFDKDSYFTSYN